ncbi:ectoine synthase [Corynebacterium sp. Marseille-P4321]|uniref:ectoine synthase n=1 Tax=Corynebacterium sp. Marseille-P4321 TaxID=2736603 RepID=UPI00158DE088|nr:ectoine synthase [Corynebacterium sp. Marseille-P4321]
MFIRSREDVETVEWGGGTSERLITAKDDMGFAVAHTVVRAGTESKLEYKNHLEACYCIAGSGEVEDTEGNIYPITPGTIYVLDEHDPHYLRGGKDEDLVLVSVFNPAITGDEVHQLDGDGFSSY